MRNNDFFSAVNDNELSYDPVTITLAAGVTREIPASCSYVEILGATTDSVSISLNGSYFFPLPIGLIVTPRNGIRRLFVRNTSGISNVIQVAKGLGQFQDNRIVFTAATTLPVAPLPTAYGARYTVSSVVLSALASVVVVAAGANVNGIAIGSIVLSCGPDPTALITVSDSTSAIAAIVDSQSLSLGAAITIPAGNQLAVATTGQCRACLTYRIL